MKGRALPPPPDVPPLPDPELPGGISLAKARERFGTFTKILPDGTVKTGIDFGPKGAISLAWCRRNADMGRPHDQWPSAGTWYVERETEGENTLDVLTWKDSDDLLIRKSIRGGFSWV